MSLSFWILSRSCDPDLTVTQIKECRSDPEGATTSKCNSAFLDKDNFICNPSGEICTVDCTLSHLSHSSPSSSLPVSPPVVYSVSYWDSSHSGLRLRLLPLLAEGLRALPVSSDGLELVLSAWEKASEGLLVVRSEYLRTRSVSGINSFRKTRGTPVRFQEEVKSRCAHMTSMCVKTKTLS